MKSPNVSIVPRFAVSVIFDEVCTMNEAFGNLSGSGTPERLRRQCAGIVSEVEELETALAELHERSQVADALCDILVFAYGVFHILGRTSEVVTSGRYDSLRAQLGGLREKVAAMNTLLMPEVPDATEVCLVVEDIITIVRGYFKMLGWDVDELMHIVFESNMSKFCATQEEVDATTAKYADLGVLTYVEGEFPTKCLKAAEDCEATDGTKFFKGKFLKGVNFREPEFGDLR